MARQWKWGLFLITLMVLCFGFSVLGVAKTPKQRNGGNSIKSLIPDMPPLQAVFDVYVGGLHLIEATIDYRPTKTNYVAVTQAKTYGLWGRMLEWHTELSSQGRIGYDRFWPQQFSMTDVWKNKPKTTRLVYEKSGLVRTEFDPPNNDKNREIVTDEQRKGTYDPVAGLMQMLAHVAMHNQCTLTMPIFEGKRRFDVIGHDAGYDVIDSQGYGFYTGKARRCTTDFKMIAGEWKDRAPSKFWQRSETEEGRDPFTIWLAPIGPKGFELPVRLESASLFGLIVVHLREWHEIASH